jgi:mannose-6-phosphate isomerase-like protein (cupin superfamily)
MHMVTLDRLARFSADAMQKVGLFETERFFCDLYCLLPGQSQRVHAHQGSDKVYCVMRGRARVRVGDEEQEVLPGQAVLAPAGDPHGVTNATGEPVTLLVFMAPKPAH